MALRVRSLVAGYPGSARPALDCVTFDVAAGTTLAIVGPSGAGKSTLLRVIAGLMAPHGGDVLLDDAPIARRPPQERRIALVFQDDALFTNMTVHQNLRFALRDRSEDGVRIAATARALHVAEHLEARPRRLSGGERQRAALARALLSDPLALLLDEPLAHLDPSLRRSVRDEIVGVRRSFAGPILYVTHDHVDAMTVGDVLAVLIDGKLEDVGDPQRVYDAPRTTRVARFLGERPMNLFEDAGAIAGIRPELIRIVPDGLLPGRVLRRESTGADAYIEVETDRAPLVVRVAPSEAFRVGDAVTLELPAESVRRFDPQTGVALA